MASHALSQAQDKVRLQASLNQDSLKQSTDGSVAYRASRDSMLQQQAESRAREKAVWDEKHKAQYLRRAERARQRNQVRESALHQERLERQRLQEAAGKLERLKAEAASKREAMRMLESAQQERDSLQQNRAWLLAGASGDDSAWTDENEADSGWSDAEEDEAAATSSAEKESDDSQSVGTAAAASAAAGIEYSLNEAGFAKLCEEYSAELGGLSLEAFQLITPWNLDSFFQRAGVPLRQQAVFQQFRLLSPSAPGPSAAAPVPRDSGGTGVSLAPPPPVQHMRPPHASAPALDYRSKMEAYYRTLDPHLQQDIWHAGQQWLVHHHSHSGPAHGPQPLPHIHPANLQAARSEEGRSSSRSRDRGSRRSHSRERRKRRSKRRRDSREDGDRPRASRRSERGDRERRRRHKPRKDGKYNKDGKGGSRATRSSSGGAESYAEALARLKKLRPHFRPKEDIPAALWQQLQSQTLTRLQEKRLPKAVTTVEFARWTKVFPRIRLVPNQGPGTCPSSRKHVETFYLEDLWSRRLVQRCKHDGCTDKVLVSGRTDLFPLPDFSSLDPPVQPGPENASLSTQTQQNEPTKSSGSPDLSVSSSSSANGAAGDRTRVSSAAQSQRVPQEPPPQRSRQSRPSSQRSSEPSPPSTASSAAAVAPAGSRPKPPQPQQSHQRSRSSHTRSSSHVSGGRSRKPSRAPGVPTETSPLLSQNSAAVDDPDDALFGSSGLQGLEAPPKETKPGAAAVDKHEDEVDDLLFCSDPAPQPSRPDAPAAPQPAASKFSRPTSAFAELGEDEEEERGFFDRRDSSDEDGGLFGRSPKPKRRPARPPIPGASLFATSGVSGRGLFDSDSE